MRTGISIALALAMSISPCPVFAGELSRVQLATLDKLIDLENRGELGKGYDLAVREFAGSAASPSYRRSVINRGQVIALRRYDETGTVTYLCTALEMLRVYQAELIETPEDRLEIPPTLERVEARATEVAAPCARPSPPPQTKATSAADEAPPAAVASPARGAPSAQGASPPSVRHEGPEPSPRRTPVRRTRPQIAIGSTLLVAGAGLATGFAACFAARPSEAARITALDAQATAAGRDLTEEELLEATAADARYTRLSNTGKVLGVFAVVGVIAGVLTLALPPRSTRRVHARPTGTGVRINF